MPEITQIITQIAIFLHYSERKSYYFFLPENTMITFILPEYIVISRRSGIPVSNATWRSESLYFSIFIDTAEFMCLNLFLVEPTL